VDSSFEIVMVLRTEIGGERPVSHETSSVLRAERSRALKEQVQRRSEAIVAKLDVNYIDWQNAALAGESLPSGFPFTGKDGRLVWEILGLKGNLVSGVERGLVLMQQLYVGVTTRETGLADGYRGRELIMEQANKIAILQAALKEASFKQMAASGPRLLERQKILATVHPSYDIETSRTDVRVEVDALKALYLGGFLQKHNKMEFADMRLSAVLAIIDGGGKGATDKQKQQIASLTASIPSKIMRAMLRSVPKKGYMASAELRNTELVQTMALRELAESAAALIKKHDATPLPDARFQTIKHLGTRTTADLAQSKWTSGGNVVAGIAVVWGAAVVFANGMAYLSSGGENDAALGWLAIGATASVGGYQVVKADARSLFAPKGKQLPFLLNRYPVLRDARNKPRQMALLRQLDLNDSRSFSRKLNAFRRNKNRQFTVANKSKIRKNKQSRDRNERPSEVTYGLFDRRPPNTIFEYDLKNPFYRNLFKEPNSEAVDLVTKNAISERNNTPYDQRRPGELFALLEAVASARLTEGDVFQMNRHA